MWMLDKCRWDEHALGNATHQSRRAWPSKFAGRLKSPGGFPLADGRGVADPWQAWDVTIFRYYLVNPLAQGTY